VAGKVAFPYFGADGRPDRNHTLGQLLPPESGFLSLTYHYETWEGEHG